MSSDAERVFWRKPGSSRPKSELQKNRLSIIPTTVRQNRLVPRVPMTQPTVFRLVLYPLIVMEKFN